MDQRISVICRQTVELCEKFCREQNNQLILLVQQLGTLFAEGGQLLLAGNGPLQPIAQQLAGQFSFRLGFDRPVLPAICLGSDSILSSQMVAAGQYEQYLVRHYRALNSRDHLLLLLNDGSVAAPFIQLRDDVIESEQPVMLISGVGQNDPLHSSDIGLCLDLATKVVPRQIELAQFAGHLLCELVEAELFGR